MSTEIANYGEYDDAALNKMLGISQESSGSGITKLKINALAEDDQDRPMQMGTFFLTGYHEDKEDTVYAKEATIRVIMPTYQYLHYDSAEKKVVAQSIIANSLNGTEFVSDNGLIRCGKLPKAKAEKNPMTPEQAKIQKDVKCKMSLWVLVSMKGKTIDGREAEVADVPAVWTVSQSAFMTAQELLEQFAKSKRSPLKYDVTVTLKKEKTGTTIYYVPIFNVSDKSSAVPGTIGGIVTSAQAYIKEKNDAVREAYDGIIRGRNSTKRAEDVVGKVLKSKVNHVDTSDLDDEIPF